MFWRKKRAPLQWAHCERCNEWFTYTGTPIHVEDVDGVACGWQGEPCEDPRPGRRG